MNNEEWRMVWTVKEVADLLGISMSLAYELFDNPDFPSINVGKKKVIGRHAFYCWVNNIERD